VATPTSPAVPLAQSHPVTRTLIVDHDEAMRARCAQAAGDHPIGDDPIAEHGNPESNRWETSAAVRDGVRAAVEYLDEEERWVLLQRWLEMETAGKGKAAKRSLRLEALRSIVCPRVGDREWDAILREHRTVRWAGELRLANVTAILSGCGGATPCRERLASRWRAVRSRTAAVSRPDGYVARLRAGPGHSESGRWP
jgi:hypothetical protein